MTLSVDRNHGLFYHPIRVAPLDGTPVYLVFKDRTGLYATPIPFKFDGRYWRSTRTNLPPASGAELVGYRTVETCN